MGELNWNDFVTSDTVILKANYISHKPYKSYTNFSFSSLVIDQNVSIPEYNSEICTLGKDPVKKRCKNCWILQSTRVVSTTNKYGWIWFCLCFCCGIIPLSCLIYCMDGFRIYHHCCPSCNAYLGSYKPKFSTRHRIFLLVLTLLTIAFLITLIYITVTFRK